MKRWIAGWLILALMLCCPALAERIEYADQSGVRVFEVNGLAGLMDSRGNVLLPAGYAEILPFEGDFAGVRKGRRWGIVDREGALAVECAYDRVEILPHRRAVAQRSDDNRIYEALFDLDTGEALREGELSITADEDFLYVLSYGSAGWDYGPPYRTEVYDADMNRVYTGAVWFIRLFGELSEDYAVVRHEDGGYALMDRSFDEAISAMADSLPEVAEGCVFYRTHVENPLADAMEALGLDRARVERGLVRYLGANGADAEDLTEFMAPLSRCGVIRPDGTATEVYGAEIRTLGRTDPPYCVKATGYESLILPTDRYGYVDTDGEYVIPPVYSDAYPFVDGAAVVREGDRWHLIDETGARVGTVEWSYDESDNWSLECFAQRVIPVQADGGFRLIGRRGESITDEVFAGAGMTFGAGHFLLTSGDGDLCVLDGDGRECLRVACDDYTFSNDVADALWLRVDGLYGLMGLDGRWRIEPCAERVDWLPDDLYAVQLPGGRWVYMDHAGRQLGPCPTQDEGEFW